MINSKILILKNDRVGDLFHSIKHIQYLRKECKGSNIDIILSEYNIGFSTILKKSNLNIRKIKYRLSIIDKIKLVKLIYKKKYTHIIILSPKNFYYYLPLIFKKILFSAIVINNKRMRPANYFRNKINFLTINNRMSSMKKHNIGCLYENVIKNLINEKQNTISKLYFNRSYEKVIFLKYIHIHSKQEFFKKYGYAPKDIINMIDKIAINLNVKIKLTGDLGENAYNNYYKKEKNINIEYIHNIKNDDLCELINDADIIITPHGTISCIAAYYSKPILDFFEPNINRGSFSEFRPVNNNIYRFHIIRKNQDYFNKKTLALLNSFI